MKKLISLALVLVSLISAAACTKSPAQTIEATTADDNTYPPETAETVETETTGAETDGETEPKSYFESDIKSYMSYFVDFFHENYKKGDDLSDINILYFALLFINNNNIDVPWDMATKVTEINGDVIRDVIQVTTGRDDIDLSAYHGSLADAGIFYNEQNDLYYVKRISEILASDKYKYGILPTCKIEESKEETIITADVYQYKGIGTVTGVRKIKFVFKNIAPREYEIQEIKVLGNSSLPTMPSLKRVEYKPDVFNRTFDGTVEEPNRDLYISFTVPDYWEICEDGIFSESTAINIMNFGPAYRVPKNFVMNDDAYTKITHEKTYKYVRSGTTSGGLEYTAYETKLIYLTADDDWFISNVFIRLTDEHLIYFSYCYRSYDYRVMERIIDSVRYEYKS